jgi:hypothetical protein
VQAGFWKTKMDTRFKKGFSGNPAGRPRGSTNKATAFRVELERHGPAVLEVVVNAALKGDLTAARIVIDRICAPLRAVDSPVSIESEGVGDALADLSKSIVRAALDGKITPAVARTLAAAL